jgi:acetyltransferase EpsM
VHIAPGAHLCGSVAIGAESLIGAGATVIPKCSIGARSVIGAGSTVITDLPGEITAVGRPAKILKKKQWPR